MCGCLLCDLGSHTGSLKRNSIVRVPLGGFEITAVTTLGIFGDQLADYLRISVFEFLIAYLVFSVAR